MIPIWFWQKFGVRKLIPGEPMKMPISDLSAIISYQEDLTEYQNSQGQSGNQQQRQQGYSTYTPTSVSAPLWRI